MKIRIKIKHFTTAKCEHINFINTKTFMNTEYI